VIALRVNGEEIELDDLLDTAKFHGQMAFVDAAIDAALICAAAERMAIEVTDDELQQAADEFRAARKLYKADAMHAWLVSRRLRQEDWEAVLEDGVLRRKVRQKVCAEKIEQHFVENRRALDAAGIAQIVLPDENVARELRAQCVEDQVNFHDLARQFPAGRFIGRLRRHQMEPLLAAAIFGAQPGEVAGPVRTNEGWCLALVESLHPATLDEATREEIAETLFQRWLQAERREAKIETPILDRRANNT
jgi:putative peptide maturation system protein